MSYSKFIRTTAIMLALIGPNLLQDAHAALPKDNFPDKLDGMMTKGVYVRKGTIGASLCNVMELDTLLSQKGSHAQIQKLINDQRPLGRGLYVLDVFQLQPMKVWLSDPTRQGRILVAVLVLQDCPEMLTAEVKARLLELKPQLHPLTQKLVQSLI